jgi:hypothetical protein
MNTRAFLGTSAAIAVLGLPSTAAAGGKLPAEGVAANPVSAPGGGGLEYTTTSARRHTVVREQLPATGQAVRRLRLRGTFTVPAVAYDGSPSGLSADGRTLVLIKPRARGPRTGTTFAVIDIKTMRLRRHIHLRGDFSFDAISRGGRIAYLVQYLSPRDVTKYAVRAYDMRARRLFRAPVVDKSEPEEDMSGIPLARVSDPQGRWAYTLYDGAEHPFVHALDTARRTAVCIDLDDVRSLRGAGLELSGNRLTVSTARGTRAVIDTTTKRVIPRRERKAAPAPAAAAEGKAGTPWLLVAMPSAALLLLAAAGRRRLARQSGVAAPGATSSE